MWRTPPTLLPACNLGWVVHSHWPMLSTLVTCSQGTREDSLHQAGSRGTSESVTKEGYFKGKRNKNLEAAKVTKAKWQKPWVWDVDSRKIMVSLVQTGKQKHCREGDHMGHQNFKVATKPAPGMFQRKYSSCSMYWLHAFQLFLHLKNQKWSVIDFL